MARRKRHFASASIVNRVPNRTVARIKKSKGMKVVRPGGYRL